MKKLTTRNSLLSRSSFGIEGKSKCFIDKQNLKEFITTKTALQKVSDKVLQAEKKGY